MWSITLCRHFPGVIVTQVSTVLSNMEENPLTVIVVDDIFSSDFHFSTIKALSDTMWSLGPVNLNSWWMLAELYTM